MKKVGISAVLLAAGMAVLFGVLHEKRLSDSSVGAQIQGSLSRLLGKDESRAYPGAALVTANTGHSPIVLPDRNAYLAQAKEDPHRTPPVILEFARSLAPKMEEALGSLAAAPPLFEALLTCGADSWELAAVRAVCIVNAGRLAEKYPERFQKPYQALKDKLPPDVSASVQASGF